ncbi:MAG: hypothetical protein ALECFALPRED_002273 [Alectoria fallacina]|uniref:Uncharacterized protein n=1 Tax=Alectoria fallacina TaxID=1903189 RepID=A0A8H3ICF7_9LECA|nr:MAG: hypothetical protein ALECFALPRED_002273 [Alectoria fallacina]
MHPLTSTSTILLLLSSSLALTTSTNTTTIAPSAAAAAAASSAPPSAATLAAATLPGGTADPGLTLYMYGDPACTDLNASATTLTNALPLSYGVASPQYPFLGFIMTRNLTGTEQLSFYSSTNESSDACGELVWAVNATDGGAGFCVPSGGVTCYNLTMS